MSTINKDEKNCPYCGHGLLFADLNKDCTKKIYYCAEEDCPIAPKYQYSKEFLKEEEG